jgi:hypothetical protein
LSEKWKAPVSKTEISSRGDALRRADHATHLEPSSPIPVTLIIEMLRFSETSVLIGTTQRDIPEDAILHASMLLSRWQFLFVYYENFFGCEVGIFPTNAGEHMMTGSSTYDNIEVLVISIESKYEVRNINSVFYSFQFLIFEKKPMLEVCKIWGFHGGDYEE